MGDRPDPMVECGFTWTIENFSKYSGGAGYMMKSPKLSGSADNFYVGWELHVYPNAVDVYHERYLSLNLHLVSTSKDEIDFNYKLSIVNRLNEKCKTKQGIKSKFRIWDWLGFKYFVSRADLMNKTNGLLVDDKLRIRCRIRVGGILKYNSLPQEVVLPVSSLPVDFWQLYLDQKHVDVTVEVNGKDFMAHKAVLAARSPVFASMFDTNMMESNNNRVVITDIEPEVFAELLRFMYSDKADNLKEVACELLACSEKYVLDRLKVMCEESISATLSVENAVDVLLMADLHRAKRLKLQAFDFIKDHASEITLTEGWSRLMNHPQLVTEAFKFIAALV